MKKAAGKLCAVMLVAMFTQMLFSQESKSSHNVTKQDIDRWKVELSNWGRWGKDDQIGTLNLVTPAKRLQAAKLVKEGFAVSLARTAMLDKAIDNTDPYLVEWYIGRDGDTSMDRFSVNVHGYAHTHFDALDHHFDVDSKAFNGYPFDREVATSKRGQTKNTVLNVKNGIFTRAILIDIPKLRGVPYLEPGTPIYVEDIEAWEKKAGVKLSPGDALFIRTGRWARRAAVGPWDIRHISAGLDLSVLPWLKKQDVALVGLDVTQMASPSLPDLGHLGHFPAFALAVMGIHLAQNCDLEALSDAAAERHRWEFLLTVAPLPIPGGTGSPINPTAVF